MKTLQKVMGVLICCIGVGFHLNVNAMPGAVEQNQSVFQKLLSPIKNLFHKKPQLSLQEKTIRGLLLEEMRLKERRQEEVAFQIPVKQKIPTPPPLPENENKFLRAIDGFHKRGDLGLAMQTIFYAFMCVRLDDKVHQEIHQYQDIRLFSSQTLLQDLMSLFPQNSDQVLDTIRQAIGKENEINNEMFEQIQNMEPVLLKEIAELADINVFLDNVFFLWTKIFWGCEKLNQEYYNVSLVIGNLVAKSLIRYKEYEDKIYVKILNDIISPRLAFPSCKTCMIGRFGNLMHVFSKKCLSFIEKKWYWDISSCLNEKHMEEAQGYLFEKYPVQGLIGSICDK